MSLLELLKNYGWQIFSDSDGFCACGEFYIGGLKFEIHCHRTSHNNCECQYAGIHISKNLDCYYKEEDIQKIAQEIKKQVEDAYMCECKIVNEKDF